MDNNGERIKDIRLMLELISKDYRRLADDIKYLNEYLTPSKEGKALYVENSDGGLTRVL